MTVDVICSVLNGDRFLPDFFQSMLAQTHVDWRLWMRDDGSTDGTVGLIQDAAAADSRIRVLHLGGPRLGVAQSFGWALERLPAPVSYVMTADADDVWLPGKIERTLAAMTRAESNAPASTPILVHTDMVVVDAHLALRHPSFWEFTKLEPEPATLHRIVVRNVATGPTVMVNAALRDRIGATPPEALHHDWWYALVAAAFGQIVAVRESTVLYRQHGANDVGAQAGLEVRLTNLPPVIAAGFKRTARFRATLDKTAAQARALLARYGEELSEADRRLLRDYARIPTQGFIGRKLGVLRLRVLPGDGWIQAIGAVLRA